MTEEYDEKCSEIGDKIIEISDKYKEYISRISIEWIEEKE